MTLVNMDFLLYESKISHIDEELFHSKHTEESFNNGLVFAKAIKYRNSFAGYYIIKEVSPTKIRIDTLGVRKKFCGKGLGKKLLEDALLEAKSRGYKRVFLFCRITNKKAIYLYESVGFEYYSSIDPYMILAFSISHLEENIEV